MRAYAWHILAHGAPQPDAGGSTTYLGDPTGSPVDGDAVCDAAEEALLHPTEGRHALAHGLHLQPGENSATLGTLSKSNENHLVV